MFKKLVSILPILLVFLCTTISLGQNISINNTNNPPDASAMLDVQSTTKGILIPRMSSLQRIGVASPTTGLLVYDTGSASFWYKGPSGWIELTDNIHGLQDADHDTKVQVEESPDEDRIRFDIGGVEGMVLEESSEGATRLDIGPDIGLIIGHDAGVNSYSGWNTILGYQAGQHTTTGLRNVFVGYQAGQNNGAGQDRNVLIGYQAGRNNNALGNTMIGYQAGIADTTGYNNTFLGYQSGVQNTNGYRNTFIGQSAGHNNETSYNNTFVGFNAGYNNEEDHNTFVGVNSGMSNRTGLYNAVVGMSAAGSALSNRDMGNGNSIIGFEAGLFSNGMAYNVLAGYRAGFNMTSGLNNVIVGNQAGHGLRDAYANVAVGVEALRTNSNGNYNVAIGDSTLRSNTASGNVAVGSKAGMHNTDGSANTFIGRWAGTSNTTGDRNTMLGSVTGNYNTEGSNNVFIGVEAANANRTGDNNTFIGFAAGFRNDNGNDNVFVGHLVAERNISGLANVAIGLRAMNANSDGSNNIAIGELALGRQDGESYPYSNNIGIGLKAGLNIQGSDNIIVGNNSAVGVSGAGHVILGHDVDPTGSFNTFLGSETGVNLFGSAAYSTAIGYGTQLRQPYTVIVGNHADSELKVGVGTNTPDARMHVSGSVDSVVFIAQGGSSRFLSKVLINTATPATGYELSVNGDIACEEVRVQDQGMWPDYVFEEDYHLADLGELAHFLKTNKHLPGIPSAAEVAQDGVRLGDLQKRMLEKVEELTLYIIELENRITGLEAQIK